jgi:hypothetical protein
MALAGDFSEEPGLNTWVVVRVVSGGSSLSYATPGPFFGGGVQTN